MPLKMRKQLNLNGNRFMTNKQKVKVFDWLNSKLEAGELELLFKDDHSGDGDFKSAASLDEILMIMLTNQPAR
ncbi:hypothetical protein C9J12_27390 [Photobacterium frigidiphilum]|uniref:Uncharacterized protein n=2 Tax=Photobacterium frigidiphilum TaxID=264736 RepID=A0A2T3J6W1_9GAMM|nr:hypothetical protein C9J12_27390 [Photobacterium frigidiphilum]